MRNCTDKTTKLETPNFSTGWWVNIPALYMRF